MAECEHCVMAEKGEKLFEDEKVAVVPSSRPASRGHVLVIPKEHYTILEQIPDFLAGHLFSTANKASTAIFEMLRVHGTNIVIENGIAAGQKVAHFAINIIPRAENDGIGFIWQSRQITDDEMSTAELQLKEQTKNVGGFQKDEKKALEVNDKEEVMPGNDNDYFLKQLKRIP